MFTDAVFLSSTNVIYVGSSTVVLEPSTLTNHLTSSFKFGFIHHSNQALTCIPQSLTYMNSNLVAGSTSFTYNDINFALVSSYVINAESPVAGAYYMLTLN